MIVPDPYVLQHDGTHGSYRDDVRCCFANEETTTPSYIGTIFHLFWHASGCGVTAYSAGRRSIEMGVRMALGASRGDAVGLILRGAFRLIFFGLIVGLPLAFVAGRFLGNQLYGVNPFSASVTSVAVAASGYRQ